MIIYFFFGNPSPSTYQRGTLRLWFIKYHD
jgi:hypothetical protein